MVSVGVSKLGFTDQIFVDPWVKVNGSYYRDVLLSQELLPVMREVSGEFFIFQQDSVPAYRARDTVRFLEQTSPAFISPDLWPPNSPDLNPVDYKVWGIVQQTTACLSVTRSRCGSTEAASLGCLAPRGTVLLTALMSGAYDFEPVCGQEGDILNKLCDYVSNSLNGQRFQWCQT